MNNKNNYYGLHTSYYLSGSENITFVIQGEHNITEDYYNCEVNGIIDHNGNVHVDGTDSNGFEYDGVVEMGITFAQADYMTLYF